jgi:hypothetical protein
VAIETMEKSDIIYITRAEFKWKRKTPSFFINEITKTPGKKFILFEDKEKLGWAVERTE